MAFEVFRCTLALIALPAGMVLGIWISDEDSTIGEVITALGDILFRPFYLVGRWIRSKRAQRDPFDHTM